MIEGLISGHLVGTAEMRDGKNASQFAVARVKVEAAAGETVVVNVIAFLPQTCAALVALDDGDALSLVGSLAPKVWTDKQGNTRPALDMVASQVLTVYQVSRKRAAIVGTDG